MFVMYVSVGDVLLIELPPFPLPLIYQCKLVWKLIAHLRCLTYLVINKLIKLKKQPCLDTTVLVWSFSICINLLRYVSFIIVVQL